MESNGIVGLLSATRPCFLPTPWQVVNGIMKEKGSLSAFSKLFEPSDFFLRFVPSTRTAYRVQYAVAVHRELVFIKHQRHRVK